jgi:hypothetical protein
MDYQTVTAPNYAGGMINWSNLTNGMKNSADIMKAMQARRAQPAPGQPQNILPPVAQTQMPSAQRFGVQPAPGMMGPQNSQAPNVGSNFAGGMSPFMQQQSQLPNFNPNQLSAMY